MEKRTYTQGPDLRFTLPVTKGDYVKICDNMGATLSCISGNGDVEIAPEPITEGGFKFVGGPYGEAGDISSSKYYKTMRHWISSKSGEVTGFRWPRITENVISEWRDSNCELIPAGFYATTCLKAFYGAPVWTITELNVIAEVLAEFGVETTNMPTSASLTR